MALRPVLSSLAWSSLVQGTAPYQAPAGGAVVRAPSSNGMSGILPRKYQHKVKRLHFAPSQEENPRHNFFHQEDLQRIQRKKGAASCAAIFRS
ncbi:hypothetical protein [Verminephrobacter aporrectodeae]|uniref:hypothetical protein n=1 Tax=Verminephrobacter aporrectodeae TaxID=1110389 RepID=UPI00224486F0|nr:hypothetical protein [Verminephrobacter aporrectodeae]